MLVRQNVHITNTIHSLLEENPGPRSSIGEVRTGNISSTRNNPLKSLPNEYRLVDSWLRRLGFYGSITFLSTMDDLNLTRIILGYNVPIWNRAVTLLLQLAFLGNCWSNISILPGYIRIQNRVPMESRFMTACRKGDVEHIRQCLDEEGMQILDNRTTCSGKTPLLVYCITTIIYSADPL